MMAGVDVAHKLLKMQEKDNNTNLTKPPLLKLFTSSPHGQAYQAMTLLLYFGLKPINCHRRDSFGCKSIPSCSCPGKQRKTFQVRIYIRKVIPKGMGSSTPVTSHRQVPILVNSD